MEKHVGRDTSACAERHRHPVAAALLACALVFAAYALVPGEGIASDAARALAAAILVCVTGHFLGERAAGFARASRGGDGKDGRNGGAGRGCRRAQVLIGVLVIASACAAVAAALCTSSLSDAFASGTDDLVVASASSASYSLSAGSAVPAALADSADPASTSFSADALPTSSWIIWLVLAVSCAATAIWEEGLFRWLIPRATLGQFRGEANPYLKAALVSALLFALVHLDLSSVQSAERAGTQAQALAWIMLAGRFIQVALFAIAMSAIVGREGEGLPASIALHACYDLACFAPVVAAYPQEAFAQANVLTAVLTSAPGLVASLVPLVAAAVVAIRTLMDRPTAEGARQTSR